MPRKRHNRLWVLVVASLIVTLLRPSGADATPTTPPELFRPNAAAAPPAAGRAQRVTLNLDLSRAGTIQVVFNPFRDVAHPIRLVGTVQADGSVVWHGALPSQPFSHVLLVWHAGFVNGTALLDGTGYAITDDGSGTLVLVERSGQEPPERDPVQPTTPGGTPAGDLPPGAAADISPEIDILVAITDDVRDGTFGGDEGAAGAWAATRVIEFNDALANSAVIARGRLAGVAFVDYAESPTSIYTDLKRLTFAAGENCSIPGDPPVCDPSGHLDEIHQLRDDHGADLVALIVSDHDQTDGAGIAWLTCTPGGSCDDDFMFSVSLFTAANGGFTMSHEIGHNLGLRHNVDNDTLTSPTYARGYRLSGKFATIMAYPITGAPRIIHFSNPDISYAGDPTGIPIGQSSEADAAYHIDAVAATVAAARPAVPHHPIGLVDPGAGLWYLRDEVGVVTSFYYGVPGDVPFMGDWDCDGIDTPGLYRQSDGFVYLRNSNSFGVADVTFFFGLPGDLPIAGDFDDNGCDTLGIYRPSEGRVYISDTLGSNGGFFVADYNYYFGLPGDKPFVGDFNGDGTDTIGLHRESTGFVYFRNSHTFGVADNSFFFGIPNDRLVAGDWGIVDGIDTPAVFRPSNTTFYFRHTNTQGNADSQFNWGSSTWLPIAGTFEGP